MPISLEEFMKLPDKPRHEYLKGEIVKKMEREGFHNVKPEKIFYDNENREIHLDVFAEKGGRKVGVEVWSDRKLFEKLERYKNVVDEVILAIPVSNIKLWAIEIPPIYKQ